MNNRETELRVADLLAMLLKAFVPIVCVVLVLGLLGGVYGVYHAKKNAPVVTEDDLKAAGKAVTTAGNSVRTAERNLNRQNEIEIPDMARQVANNENLTERRQTYIDNSQLQQLNAFRCGVSRIKFYVKAELAEEIDTPEAAEQLHNMVALAYAEGYLHDSTLIGRMRTILNTDADDPYILEMAEVVNTSGRFVEIVAYHSDAGIAEQIANALFDSLNKRVNETVAPHEANVITTYTGYEINWDLYNAQIANQDKLIAAERALEESRNSYQTMLNSLGDKEQAVTDAQAAYEDAVKQQASLQKQYDNPGPGRRALLKGFVLYGVIGAAAGLVLACIVVWLVNLLNGKLHNQTEARSRYAFPVIGVLPRAAKRLFVKATGKLEGDSLGSFEAKAQATAQSLLYQIGERSVCLVSTLGGEAAEKLIPYTNGKTPVCGNILSDADAIRKLDAYDGVVLIEQRDKSRLALIDAEVSRVQSLKKEVVGIVLL